MVLLHSRWDAVVRAELHPVVVVVLAVAALAPFLGSGGAVAVAPGDTWKYEFYEKDPGVEWFGNVTIRFASASPGSPIVFDRSGAGILRGDAKGIWSLYAASRYRASDGAFADSNSTFRILYVEFGRTYDVITETAIFDNPPVDLGGTLQVGKVVRATTNETVTQVQTVNNVTGNPVTRTTTVSIQERVVSRVTITVPAATFDTWLIEFTQSDIPGRTEQYYSEAIGNSVLIREYDGSNTLRATYSLKGSQPDLRITVPLTTIPVAPLAAVGATGAIVAMVVWRDRRRITPLAEFPRTAPPPPPQP